MVLYINACVRQDSRTDRIARALLNKLGEYRELRLDKMNLMPLDEKRLAYRSEKIATGSFDDEIFDLAKEFAAADTIVISAPYWDGSFPAALKVYIENIYVTGIVSKFNEKGVPVGLCKASRLYYVTTAGGSYDKRFSYDYISQLATGMLGIKDTQLIMAELLDIDGMNADDIVAATIAKIKVTDSENKAAPKNCRFVSVEGCELIGQGKHGKVFRLNEEQIIKTYYDKSSLSIIEREREYSKKAFVLGIPTAITFGLVETELGYGVIYESAGIMPLGTYLESHPDKLDEYAKKFADILVELNNTEADTTVFESIHEWYIEQLKSIPTKFLSKKDIASLIHIVEAIPVKTTFLHTDFHTQNVMIDKNGELLLIDMADIGYGNNIFDVASSYMTLCYMPKTNKKESKSVSGLSPKNSLKFWNTFVRRYYNTNDDELISAYELRLRLLSYVRMAIVLSFSIELGTFEKYIIAFIVRTKLLRNYNKYSDILKNFDIM